MMTESEKETYMLHAMLPGFKRKVEKSLTIIQKALQIDGVKWSASISFGKDSLVLLDLLQKIKMLPVIYMSSPYRLPDHLETIERVTESYHLDLRIIPEGFGTPIDEIWKKYGVPGMNRTAYQTNLAVKYLKKDPSDKYCKGNGINGIFWGLRKEESIKRKWLIMSKGATFETVNGFWRCAPLANWLADDIWAYIVSENLYYPALYDNEFGEMTRANIRNTSWVTTDGAENGRLLWLKKFYPNYFDELLWLLPKIKEYL